MSTSRMISWTEHFSMYQIPTTCCDCVCITIFHNIHRNTFCSFPHTINQLAITTASLSQMIWDTTKYVGCGMAKSRDTRYGNYIIVCNYGPAWVQPCAYTSTIEYVIWYTIKYLSIHSRMDWPPGTSSRREVVIFTRSIYTEWCSNLLIIKQRLVT